MNKMRNVTIFMQSFDGGGVQTIMINLANGLNQAGYNTNFAVADARGPMRNKVSKPIRIFDFDKKRYKGDFKVLFSLLCFVGFVRSEKPDLIIAAPGFSSAVAIVGRMLSHDKHKLIIVVDNKLSLMLTGKIKNVISYYIYRFLYKFADEIVVANKNATIDFLDNFKISKHKVHTIYNPLIDMSYLSITKPNYQLLKNFTTEGYKTLISVGRLVREKDYINLIDAFYLASLKYSSIKLVIVGTGPELNSINSRIMKYQISDRVMMYGYSENPYELLKVADIFVLSSKQDAFPGALVEALSCGLTVSATDCDSGGPREILDDGKYGYLCPKEDAVALADCITRAITVPISHDIAAKRGEFFSIENSVKAYVKLIDSCLSHE